MDSKKTLYIGAHPDDVFLGAAIALSRDPKNSFVLTLCNGAPINEKYPSKHGGMTFQTSTEYAGTRLAEDMNAMDALGLDTTNHYFNFGIPDLLTHNAILSIIDKINDITRRKSIERIVSHVFPEAHPDHEIACFCSHYAARKDGIGLLEFPLYYIDGNGNEVIREFSDVTPGKIVTLDFSQTERDLKEKVRQLYPSQRSVTSVIKRDGEIFREVSLDTRSWTTPTTYIFKVLNREIGTPLPEEIRTSINDFLKNQAQ